MRKFENVEEGLAEYRPSLFRKLLKLLLWGIAGIAFLLVSLVIMISVYENDIKAAMVKELNKHLEAEVKIDPENIDITIIRTFPDCSIQFSNLLMLEALPVKQRDTLLFAQRLNLHFNISDIWNKRYNIEKIRLRNAKASLKVFKSGKTNYRFWKKSSGHDQKQDSLSFDLKLLAVDNFSLSYSDQQQSLKTKLEFRHLDFKGKFGQSQFDLSSKATVFIHSLSHQKNNYLRNKQLDVSVLLAVDGTTYAFRETKIRLNNLALELGGKFRYQDSLCDLNLSFRAPSLDIASLLSLLPAAFKADLEEYESSGNFYAQGSFAWSGKEHYKLVTGFGIKNGTITYRPKSTTAKQVNIEGDLLLTPGSSQLGLKNLRFQLNNDELSGSCVISNLSDPGIRLQARARLHLENLLAFYPIDTLTQLKGELLMNADIAGRLSDLKNETFSKKVKLDLDASIAGLEAQFKNDDKLYKVEQCAVTAKDREIEVRDLKLHRGASDLTVNGKIPGLFNYLLDRQAPLIISGSLTSELIDLDDFITSSSSSASSTATPDLIPGNMQFRLNTEIARFSFGKFKASHVSGEIEIKDRKAIVSDVHLETMQGSADINAFADNSRNRLDVVLQSRLGNISISELFSQLNNFGQTTLQDKNLKGFASADIEFSGTWNNRLECDYKSIRATCNLQIERGELIGFKPLLSLSRFVDIDDLQRIRFATLKSNISIASSTITFPRTSIKNSALDLEFWGTHTFSNAIDYHIQLLISDLLAKKRRHKENDEFGPVERDKENTRSAFIRMTGTVDNPVIKYDRQGMKEKIRGDIKAEKQNIRQILKEEFGLFKKDSSVRKPKTEPVFELEKQNSNPPKKTLEPKKKEEEDF